MIVFKTILNFQFSILTTLLLHYFLILSVKFTIQIKYIFKTKVFNNSIYKIMIKFISVNLVVVFINYLYLNIFNLFINDTLYLQYFFIILVAPFYYYFSKNVIFK